MIKKMLQGYTFQTNRKGLCAVEIEEGPSGPLVSPNHTYGKRLEGVGGGVYVTRSQFFTDPEEGRAALIAFHEKNLALHEENARKSRAIIEKVKSQKIKPLPAGPAE